MRILGRRRKKQNGTDNEKLDGITEVEQAIQRRKDADSAGHVRGQHFTELVPTLNALRSAGAPKADEYLGLLLEIIDAAEQAASIEGVEPAPGYTRRAAVIYRRRKDYAAELALLERYEAACPSGRGGTFSERIQKAESLLEVAP
ncbi:hypothetical protein CIK75_02520 [Glutamicibacter sp. BW78]|uniref:hypothetical protein n=1 Tax=Glutamicibacter sp. BW78 TaxID=2024403 RepID=UPI000BB93BA0|nr:hypothetical protein [Glutamicibacter sp. BW78]PCC26516.1 hypothetical protein CIK75_02520 [Glutamicibacter sp. BW78]